MDLVTGGSGYFGATLVRALLAQGKEVRVFDLNAPAMTQARLSFVRGDVRDSGALRAAAKGAETVHHNVAQVPLARDRKLFFAVNAEGTRNALAAALASGARKFVYTSSSAVFGAPESNPVTEETPPRPQEAYGRAKLEGERIARDYASRGLDVTIVRPRTILGPGRLGIFQILFEWIWRGQNVPVFGSGGNLYQFVHAEDLAAACLAAAARPGFAVYNIGAAQFGTMREALENLIVHARSQSRVKSVNMRLAKALMGAAGALGLSPLSPYHALMYGRAFYFDIERAKRELSFAPRHGNDAMFAESYDWYAAHREEILSGRMAGSKHQSVVRQKLLSLLPRFI